MIPGITEEDEDELDMDEDMEVEEVDQFGPELVLSSDLDAIVDEPGGIYTEPVSPLSPMLRVDDELVDAKRTGSSGVPLTAEALQMKLEQDEKLDRQATV